MENTDDYSSDSECFGIPDDLPNEDKETQLKVMRTWFFGNFEDPVERTPYESREDGYIWIWGGPYNAQEELYDKFGGIVPDDVIEELSLELDETCYQWAPTAKPGDYDEYLVDDIAQITEYHYNFSNAILDIKRLLETSVADLVENCFYRLLYVNVITALETYLSDAFINLVVTEKNLMRRFIENAPKFKSEKIPLSDVLKVAEEIEQRAKSYLAEVVWHNIERVKPMYHDVLGVSFPHNIGDLMRAVLKRHDIVHRNGKDKNDKKILITRDDINTLIQKVEAFVQTVDQELNAAKAKSTDPCNDEEDF